MERFCRVISLIGSYFYRYLVLQEECMDVRILKFGGTSVADSKAINRVIKIVANNDSNLVIVVSACSQVTNKLSTIITHILQQESNVQDLILEIGNQHSTLAKQLNVLQKSNHFIEAEIKSLGLVCKKLQQAGVSNQPLENRILASGERLSSKIIANAMQKQLGSVEHIDANELISVNRQYGSTIVDFSKTEKHLKAKLLPIFKSTNKVVMAGFICAGEDGEISNLGRGGSDYSAAVVGNCLDASAIEIWTDVDGILTSDPSKVSETQLIAQLSYQEAAELAYFGAKVLHPKTMGPASRKNIPVYVKNTFKSELPGTKVLQAIRTKNTIKSIASREKITLVTIQSNHMYGAYGFLRRVFEVFDRFHCPVDVVTTSEVSVSITIEDTSQLEAMLKQLNTFSITQAKHKQAIVAVVGDGLKQTAGVSAKIFNAIEDIPISMISMGASDVNLTLVVDEIDQDNVIQKLHNAFF